MSDLRHEGSVVTRKAYGSYPAAVRRLDSMSRRTNLPARAWSGLAERFALLAGTAQSTVERIAAEDACDRCIGLMRRAQTNKRIVAVQKRGKWAQEAVS